MIRISKTPLDILDDIYSLAFWMTGSEKASNELVNRTYLNVDFNTQETDLLKERVRMYDALKKIKSIRVFESDTNFIIIRVSDAKKVFLSLAGEGILVRNVSGYPLMENCLRFNVGLKEENDFLLEKLGALR